MLDSGPDQSPPSQDWGLRNANNWHLHFCLWPKTCYLTRKRIWFNWCYKGQRRIRQDIEFVLNDYYVDRNEFIMWRLRGNHGIV